MRNDTNQKIKLDEIKFEEIESRNESEKLIVENEKYLIGDLLFLNWTSGFIYKKKMQPISMTMKIIEQISLQDSIEKLEAINVEGVLIPSAVVAEKFDFQQKDQIKNGFLIVTNEILTPLSECISKAQWTNNFLPQLYRSLLKICIDLKKKSYFPILTTTNVFVSNDIIL